MYSTQPHLNVKLFSSDDHSDLEKKVNEYLRNLPSSRVKDVKIISGDKILTAMVITQSPIR
ncbi:MAG: sporulation protein Cse60 [Desulfotomaculum sp.]|nr:sporulation protein Cse60 [Desulfotomaculum sp.]